MGYRLLVSCYSTGIGNLLRVASQKQTQQGMASRINFHQQFRFFCCLCCC